MAKNRIAQSRKGSPAAAVDTIDEERDEPREGIAIQLGARGVGEAKEGLGGAFDAGEVAGGVEDAVGEHVADVGGDKRKLRVARVGKERAEVVRLHERVEGGGGGRFDERELEEALPDVARGPSAEEEIVARGDVEIMEETVDRFRAVLLDGEALRCAGGMGGATRGEWADAAIGVAGDALQGAELHDGLVVCAGLIGREETAGQIVVEAAAGGCVGGRIDGEESADDAQHIPVDDGVRRPGGEGHDGGGRVVANAAEGADGGVIRGEASGEAIADVAGGGVEVTGAGIVAEALPEPEDVLLRGVGQGADVGEALEEAVVIVHPLRHAGLLEDDLGNPDAVGVAGVAPGQRAAVRVVPPAERAAHVIIVRHGVMCETRRC